jgi:hypothetical protein
MLHIMIAPLWTSGSDAVGGDPLFPLLLPVGTGYARGMILPTAIDCMAGPIL